MSQPDTVRHHRAERIPLSAQKEQGYAEERDSLEVALREHPVGNLPDFIGLLSAEEHVVQGDGVRDVDPADLNQALSPIVNRVKVFPTAHHDEVGAGHGVDGPVNRSHFLSTRTGVSVQGRSYRRRGLARLTHPCHQHMADTVVWME